MDLLYEIAAVAGILSLLWGIYVYLRPKAPPESGQVETHKGGLVTGRDFSTKIQQGGAALFAGGDVNIHPVGAKLSGTRNKPVTEPRVTGPRLGPQEAIRLLREQLARLEQLAPRSLTDTQWQSWRTLTAEILHRAGPSRNWPDEFRGVAKKAIQQWQNAELYASEVEGLPVSCENLRNAERAYLESVIEIIELDSAQRNRPTDEMREACARLRSLRSRLQRETSHLADEDCVEEFHVVLALFQRSTGQDLSRFRVPPSKMERLPTGGFNIPRIRRSHPRPPEDITMSEEQYCDREFLSMRVDTVSQLFDASCS